MPSHGGHGGHHGIGHHHVGAHFGHIYHHHSGGGGRRAVPHLPITVKRRPLPTNIVEVVFQWQTNPLPSPAFPSQLSPFLSATEFQSLVLDAAVAPVQKKQRKRNLRMRLLVFVFFLLMVAGGAVLGVGSEKASDDYTAASAQFWASEERTGVFDLSNYPYMSDYTIESRYPGMMGAGIACIVIGFLGIMATACLGCGGAGSAAQSDLKEVNSALQKGSGELAGRGMAISVYEEDAVLLVQVGYSAPNCTEMPMKICTLQIQCPAPVREPMTYLTHGSLKSDDGSSAPMPLVIGALGTRVGIPISCMPDASSQFVLVSPNDLVSPINQALPLAQQVALGILAATGAAGGGAYMGGLVAPAAGGGGGYMGGAPNSSTQQQQVILQQQQILQLQQQQLAALGMSPQGFGAGQLPRPEGTTATAPYMEGPYAATATMAPYPPPEVAKNGGTAPLYNPYTSTATAGEGLGGGAPPPPLPVPYSGSVGL